jgi:hypothetical protein
MIKDAHCGMLRVEAWVRHAQEYFQAMRDNGICCERMKGGGVSRLTLQNAREVSGGLAPFGQSRALFHHEFRQLAFAALLIIPPRIRCDDSMWFVCRAKFDIINHKHMS